MDAAVVVVNWNGAAHLRACLEGFLAQEHAPLDIVVVDNASTDASADVVGPYLQRDTANDGHRVRLVRNDVNRGYAGGANDGIAATDAPAVVVCNPDVVPRPDLVRRLTGVLDVHRGCGAVQPKLLRATPGVDGRPVIDTTGHEAFRTRLFRNRGEGEPDAGQWDRSDEIFGVSGALACYRRAMLEDVAVPRPGGGVEVFDEELFAYFEDVDLDWRAALRGWSARYEPRAVATHERGGAGPRRTPTVEALNWRNRLLVLVKCDDVRAVAVVAPAVVVTTLLKTLELGITVPRALLVGMRGLDRIGAMRRKRRFVQARATVPSRAVVRRWFGPFDYRRWVRTWWRRIRGRAPGVA